MNTWYTAEQQTLKRFSARASAFVAHGQLLVGLLLLLFGEEVEEALWGRVQRFPHVRRVVRPQLGEGNLSLDLLLGVHPFLGGLILVPDGALSHSGQVLVPLIEPLPAAAQRRGEMGGLSVVTGVAGHGVGK